MIILDLIINFAILAFIIRFSLQIIKDNSCYQETNIDENYKNWINSITKEFPNATLKDVRFLGTHDAGSYELFSKLAPKANSFLKKLVSWNPDFFESIKQFAKCQSSDIYGQLIHGARYLDIRIAFDEDEDARVFHALFGNKIQVILNDIKKFIQEVNGEIVILRISRFYFPDSFYEDQSTTKEEKKNKMMNLINNVFENFNSTLSPNLIFRNNIEYNEMNNQRKELFNMEINQILTNRKFNQSQSGVIAHFDGFDDFFTKLGYNNDTRSIFKEDLYQRWNWAWEIEEISSYANRWSWEIVKNDQFDKLKKFADNDYAYFPKEVYQVGYVFKYSWQITYPRKLNWNAIYDLLNHFGFTFEGRVTCGNNILYDTVFKIPKELRKNINLIYLDFFESSKGVDLSIELTKEAILSKNTTNIYSNPLLSSKENENLSKILGESIIFPNDDVTLLNLKK